DFHPPKSNRNPSKLPTRLPEDPVKLNAIKLFGQLFPYSPLHGEEDGERWCEEVDVGGKRTFGTPEWRSGKHQTGAGVARENDAEPDVDRRRLKDGKLDLSLEPAAFGILVEAVD
ncbi:MAG: hypothetical protein O2960_16945, partial [Verrucomicrobia bacterium]|nr:hypothetical protein [Verrucomicrobiota bacterium]